MVSIIDTEKQKQKIKVVNEIIKILSDEDKEKDKWWKEFNPHWGLFYDPEIPQRNSATEYYKLYCHYKKIGFVEKAKKALYYTIKLDVENPIYIREVLLTELDAVKYAYRDSNDSQAKQLEHINLANLLIKIENNKPENYILRSKIYAKEDNLFLAVKDLFSAINLGDRHYSVFELLGDYYLQLKEYNLAVNAYTKAIEKSLGNSDLYCKRGKVKYHKGQLVEALYDVNQALHYDDCNKNAYYLKHNICTHTNEIEFIKKNMGNSLHRYIDTEERKKYILYLRYLEQIKDYEEELKILNYLLLVEWDFEHISFYLAKKFKVLKEMRKYIQLIPVAKELCRLKIIDKINSFKYTFWVE